MRRVVLHASGASSAGALLLIGLLTAACGGNAGSGGSGAGSTSASSGSATGGSTGAGTCPGDLAEAPNSAFCAAQAATPDCSFVGPDYHTQVCGVPLKDPKTALARSSGVKEFAGSGPPDLGCVANPPKGGTSQMVTISGLAKIFSHGCQSNGVLIEVFALTGDADLAMPALASVTTAMDCMAAGVPTVDSNCGTRYECKYSVANVPSETELAIRTSGQFWAPLIDYNNYIFTADVKGGTWTHDVRALATDDYSVIPQAAIGSPITPGNGAVAGEVHDCGDVRLTDATVGIDAQVQALTYFTNDEQNPLPDLSATSTSVLGLWAGLDMPPGPVSVAALGLVGGKVTTVGYHRVRVFPNAVTAVTFRGVIPTQVGP